MKEGIAMENEQKGSVSAGSKVGSTASNVLSTSSNMDPTTSKAGSNALRINKIRCILAIVMCALLSFFELMAMTSQILIAPDALVQEVGWKSYHMFTILSNLLMGVIAAMCIPFAVDGVRYRNYHLPRWYVNLMYMGTTGVAITFLVALTVLSPMAGFYRMMFYSNNILFHLTCPVLAIVLFLFINTDHRIDFKSSFIAIIPVALYSALYMVMVFVIGEEAGGWRDHYQVMRVMEYLPLPAIVLVLFGISLAIANIIRVIHNIIHIRRKESLKKYYQTADAFDYPDIRSAIKALARIDRPRDKGGELTVPRRIMSMMEEKYQSGLSIEEMCNLYIHEYYGYGEGEFGDER